MDQYFFNNSIKTFKHLHHLFLRRTKEVGVCNRMYKHRQLSQMILIECLPEAMNEASK